jgi:hypothetical protein
MFKAVAEFGESGWRRVTLPAWFDFVHFVLDET